MQNKRFDEAELATIPTLTGINTLVLEVADEHRINFHGIRYCGRIMADDTTGADKYQHGYVTLLCVPNDQVALSGIFDVNDMIDWNAMIIAIMPWATWAGGTGQAGASRFFDFNITPKTSRTCAKGGKIVAQVTNVGLASVVVNALLTSFTTTV